MALEIERKFLVTGDGWRLGADAGTRMSQGYLTDADRVSVRVRVAGEHAWLNIKHALSITVRREYEYPMPLADARELLDGACRGALVDKTRYRVPHDGRTWEVDVFHGDNDGLVIAELELAREDETFALPAWVGADVSLDARYLNHHLAHAPYRDWRSEATRR